MIDSRQAQSEIWLKKQLTQPFDRVPVKGDASFRRYFRVITPEQTYMLVDAPPEHENNHAFVTLARRFAAEGILVPHIYQQNFDQGFLLISDFGDCLYWDAINESQEDVLYGPAIKTLLRLQSCFCFGNDILPTYNEPLLRQEMQLFSDWYLEQHLGIRLSNLQKTIIEYLHDRLVASALSQPQVCVHRDYHSRNLMVTDHPEPGVIDFQDAVKGPITYDLVSLLRDCYIDWPPTMVHKWLKHFFEALPDNHRDGISYEQFQTWFDWMGLQRHLKAIGIFARLNYRDKKPSYMQSIPRTLKYVVDVVHKYEAFHEFAGLLVDCIPHLEGSS